jgi:hypothetical protein
MTTIGGFMAITALIQTPIEPALPVFEAKNSKKFFSLMSEFV